MLIHTYVLSPVSVNIQTLEIKLPDDIMIVSTLLATQEIAYKILHCVPNM